jgi:N-acetylglucosamine kinase-like BadF-type ATPase
MFLGVDGGGTKTAYALIDAQGALRARHVGPSVSHLAEGFARAEALLASGIATALKIASLQPADVEFAFVGLPAYGEDSASTSRLSAMPAAIFPRERYRCGNDMVCSWAGSLACQDGISVIAGTGSMAYGEYVGRAARAGGWGELIGDEGSAYWIAREGMNLFSRMSDGRAARGPLYELVRARCGLAVDLDLCAHVYGVDANTRSTFAQFAPLVHEATEAGDVQAAEIFSRGALALVECVVAVRRALCVADTVTVPVSHSGSVLSGAPVMLDAFRKGIANANACLEFRSPQHAPDIGAALYAARLAGAPIDGAAIQRMRSSP